MAERTAKKDFLEEVENVAAVARLELTEAEKKRFAANLASVLDAFKVLDKAKVDKLEPAFHPIELADVVREDKVEPSLPQETALANSPEENKEKGYFKGPKVV